MAAKFVSYVRRSIDANEILEEVMNHLAKVLPRWNSELKSIRSLLNVSETKLELLDSQ